jgi:hypothetical protein
MLEPARSYNSAYRSYPNDCTNFVSQALNWSGWQHVGGWYDDPHYWWYSPSTVVVWGRAEARAWINATYLWYFARYSGRGVNASSIYDFLPGDVLQIDYSAQDGVLDHTEIATTVDSGGNVFFTSHSVSVLDKSFWDIAAGNPGAAYYGTLMNYSY